MKFLIFVTLILIHKYTVMEIDLGDTELPNNILKFGYGINYKCVGKVSHSIDRFYVVTKFELPKVEDLQFDDIPYDAECAHLGNLKPGQIPGMIKEEKHCCVKIASHIKYYRKKIAYYNQIATDILINVCGDTQQGANVLHLITEVKQSLAQFIHVWVNVLLALLYSVIHD